MSELHRSVIAAILRSIDSKAEDQQLQRVQAMITSGAEASGMKIRPERQLVYEWYTPSLARSVAFLQALGFKVLRQEEAFAEMGWGTDSRLFMEEVPEDPAMPAGYHDVYHGNIRVLVPDVDAVYQAALLLPDGKILKTLEDRYYGLRDFTLGGPLDSLFASPLPFLAFQKIEAMWRIKIVGVEDVKGGYLHVLDSSETAQPIYIESKGFGVCLGSVVRFERDCCGSLLQGTTSVLGYSSTQVFQ